MQGTWVWSMDGELRSHKPRGNKVWAPQLLSPLALKPGCHNQTIQAPQGKIPGAATESQCSQISKHYIWAFSATEEGCQQALFLVCSSLTSQQPWMPTLHGTKQFSLVPTVPSCEYYVISHSSWQTYPSSLLDSVCQGPIYSLERACESYTIISKPKTLQCSLKNKSQSQSWCKSSIVVTHWS